MLKIAQKQHSTYLCLAERITDLVKDDSTSIASLELLVNQHIQRYPGCNDYLICAERRIRFYIDRRYALLDWLECEKKVLETLSLATVKDIEGHLMAFNVSAMEWGDSYLYSYQPSVDSQKVYRLMDIVGDLSWYHTSRLVGYKGFTAARQECAEGL